MVVQRVECVTCQLWERIDSSTFGVTWRKIWFLGTKRSTPLAAIAIMAKKLVVVIAKSVVVTVELVIVTVDSSLSVALWSWL